VKTLVAALVSLGMVITAAAADDTCVAQAVANKLRGDELKSFMANCKALAQMACEGRAIDQKVAEDAKSAFIKQCIKTELGR
jgi:hypothetical protein